VTGSAGLTLFVKLHLYSNILDSTHISLSKGISDFELVSGL